MERQRRRNGEGGGAAAPAQWPGGPSPGAEAPAQPGGWTTTMIVGVRGRTETLPLLGQAVLVDAHEQWCGSGGGTARAAGQSGYVVERRHSPSWGRQCSSTWGTRKGGRELGGWGKGETGERGKGRRGQGYVTGNGDGRDGYQAILTNRMHPLS